MAERIDSIVAPSAFQEIEDIKKGLGETSTLISNLNRNAGSIELKLGDVKSVMELNTLLKELGNTNNEITKITREQATAVAALSLAQQRLEQANLANERANTQKLKTQEQEIKNADRLQDSYDKQIAANEKAAAAKIKADEDQIRSEEKILQKIEADQLRRLAAIEKQNAVEEKAANDKIKADDNRIRSEERLIQKLEADLNKRLAQIRSAEEAEAKLAQELTNDYGMLSKAYNEAALRAKNYALQNGENHPITLQAIADAKAMGDTLKRLDASVGQFQRNVGNYNMVGAQFNQLLRELPNAAQSLNIFIMALSNNLTFFVEAVNQARAAGQSWGQIIVGLGKNLIGVVGITNLLVLGLSLWSRAQQDNARKQKELNEELTETQKLSKESATNAAKETSQLRLLYEVATNYTNTFAQRAGAVKQLQSLYPEYFGNLRTEAFLAGEAAGAYFELANALFARARANALSSRFNALAERELAINERLAEIDKERGKFKNDGKTFTLGTLEDESRLAKLGEERNKLDAELTDIRQKQTGYSKELALYTDQELRAKKEVTKEMVEQLKATFKLQQDGALPEFSVDSPQATQMQILMLEEAQRLRMLQESYASGFITYKQYQEGRAKIADTVTRDIIKLQIEETKALLENKGLSIDQRTKLETSLANLTKQLRKDEVDDVKKKEKEKRDALRETIEVIRSAQEILNEFGRLRAAQTDAELDKLNTQSEDIKAAGDVEVQSIQASTLSEEQKQQKIQESQARTAAKQEEIRRKEQQAKQRQAQYDKQLAIMNIIIGTAVAVASAKTIPARIAAAAVGAAQLAVAIATPIPQYAEGTTDHKGGYAEVAENEPEVIKEPGKDPYVVSKRSVVDLPKHTQVFNQEQLHAMLMPSMMGLLNKKRTEKMDSRIADAIERNGKNTIRAIKQNRAQLSVGVYGSDPYYLKYVKGKA